MPNHVKINENPLLPLVAFVVVIIGVMVVIIVVAIVAIIVIVIGVSVSSSSCPFHIAILVQHCHFCCCLFFLRWLAIPVFREFLNSAVPPVQKPNSVWSRFGLCATMMGFHSECFVFGMNCAVLNVLG